MNRMDIINNLVDGLPNNGLFDKIIDETIYLIVDELESDISDDDIFECLIYLIDAIKNYNRSQIVRRHDLSFIDYCQRIIHLNYLIYKQAKIDYPKMLLKMDGDIFIPSMNVLIKYEQLRNYVGTIRTQILEKQKKGSQLLKTQQNI